MLPCQPSSFKARGPVPAGGRPAGGSAGGPAYGPSRVHERDRLRQQARERSRQTREQQQRHERRLERLHEDGDDRFWRISTAVARYLTWAGVFYLVTRILSHGLIDLLHSGAFGR